MGTMALVLTKKTDYTLEGMTRPPAITRSRLAVSRTD